MPYYRPDGSQVSPCPRLSAEVEDLLECCALSTGASDVGILANFRTGFRVVHEHGDVSGCRELVEAAHDSLTRVTQKRCHSGRCEVGQWWAAPIEGATTELLLVALARDATPVHPQVERLVSQFARQLTTCLSKELERTTRVDDVEPPRSPGSPQWRALELISEAVVALDRQMRFSYLNAAAEALFSCARSELMGLSALDTFPPSADTKRAFERAIEHGESTILKDYSEAVEAWLETRIYPSPDGVLVYIRDVTERHNQREELRRSEQRFRLLSAATNDAVWEWDIERNTIVWSDAIEEITGYSVEHLSDPQAWASLVHPDDVARLIDGVAHARECEQGAAALEYRFRHAGGHEIHIAVRGEVQFDDDGVPTRLLGGVSDVTERHRMTTQLMQTDRLETLGRLASSIAHDLNNLLTPMMLSLSMIESQDPEPAIVEEVEFMKSSIDCGADLTRRLLRFASGYDGERALVDLSEVAERVHKMLRISVPSSVAFDLEIEPNLPRVNCDPSQMHQVLTNLCINAGDATSAGDEIALQLGQWSGTPPGDASGTARDFVRISVSDTGCGIAPDELDAIFEPFFTTKPSDKGTGLGLSTVRSIVEAHDGFIEVVSDTRTTFTLWLPACATEQG